VPRTAANARGEDGADGERFADADRARGHGSSRGALDVAIEVAVGDVVGGAAGAAHQERADDEHDEQVPAGEAFGGDPERGERRPEEQPRSGWPVPADEVEPQRHAAAHTRRGHVHRGPRRRRTT